MNVKAGFTPVDSYYELLGFQYAQDFYVEFFGFFSAFLVGCALIHLLLKKDSTLSELLLYIVYLTVIAFLLYPTTTEINLPEYASSPEEFQAHFEDFGRKPSVTAPLVMVVMHTLVDQVVHSGISRMKRRARDMQDADALAKLLRSARIYDSALADRYHAFLVSCYVRAYGISEERDLQEGERPDDLNPFTDPHRYYPDLISYDTDGRRKERDGQNVTCKTELSEIRNALWNHIESTSVHRKTLDQMAELQNRYRARGRTNWKVTVDHHQFLLNVIASNQARALFNVAGKEIEAIASSAPNYNVFAGEQGALSNPSGAWETSLFVVGWVVRVRQSVEQWFSHHAETTAMYYKFVNYGPYVYGIAMLFILAIFPVAAFVAFVPWGWVSFLKWGKYLLWIKLWPLFWTILADFNEARYLWDNEWSQRGLSADPTYMWGGIVAMYLAVPSLSLLVLHLMDKTTMAVISGISAVPGGAGGAGGAYFSRMIQAGATTDPQQFGKNMVSYVSGQDNYQSNNQGQGGGGGGMSKADIEQIGALL